MVYRSKIALAILLLTHVRVDAGPDASSLVLFLQSEVKTLNALLTNPGPDLEQKRSQLMDRTVDFGVLSSRTFKDYCEETLEDYENRKRQQLVELCQQQLVEVYRKRLVADLSIYFGHSTIPLLHIVDYQLSGDEGYAELTGEIADGKLDLRCYVQWMGNGWKIVDLAIGDKRISEKYRTLCQYILEKEYSLPVLAAYLEHRDYIVLEDFSTTLPGYLPGDWGWRQKDENKPKLYQVIAENGRHYLAAQDTGSTVILLKYSHWNPRQYPILTWCWRVNSLPPGGNERLNHVNDSAAGIYVIFSTNWLGVPKQIKYVWSSTLPEGTVDRRQKIFRPWFFVVESGEKNLGKWTFEQVDIYRDHRRVFDSTPKKRTIGLGILTDANNTKSYAEAYYADMRVWSKDALDKGLIEDYCSGLGNGSADETSSEHYRSLLPLRQEYDAEGSTR